MTFASMSSVATPLTSNPWVSTPLAAIPIVNRIGVNALGVNPIGVAGLTIPMFALTFRVHTRESTAALKALTTHH